MKDRLPEQSPQSMREHQTPHCISLPPHPSSSLSHDEDGNLLEDKQNRYTWNAENRLIAVHSKDGASQVEYSYDYQGRRTTKKQSIKNQEPRTTIHLYDGWNILAEIETEGQGENGLPAGQQSPSAPKKSRSTPTPTYYTWGRDLSGTLQGAGGVGGLLAITPSRIMVTSIVFRAMMPTATSVK